MKIRSFFLMAQIMMINLRRYMRLGLRSIEILTELPDQRLPISVLLL